MDLTDVQSKRALRSHRCAQALRVSDSHPPPKAVRFLLSKLRIPHPALHHLGSLLEDLEIHQAQMAVVEPLKKILLYH